MTPFLVDYGLETATPFDLSHASDCEAIHGRLDQTRPRILLFNLLGAGTKGITSVLKGVSSEIADYMLGAKSILVVIVL